MVNSGYDGRAHLIGFVRILERPPAFCLPVFAAPQKEAPREHYGAIAQEIDAQERISAFVSFDPEDLEIVPISCDINKAIGDKCVLIFEINHGNVLMGEHSRLRERLQTHLDNEIFASNPFSFHQAARFCGSGPAINEAIRRMQLKLTRALGRRATSAVT